jgi:TPR repeat protein
MFTKGQEMRKIVGEFEPKKHIRRDAEYSRTETLNLLRKRYAKCISIKKELVDAVKHYRNDAEQGDAEAQYHLGCCYQFGDGVIKNKVEAVKWFRKSAKQGYGQARELLEVIKKKNKAER